MPVFIGLSPTISHQCIRCPERWVGILGLCHHRQHGLAQALGFGRLRVLGVVRKSGGSQLLGAFVFNSPVRDQQAARTGVEKAAR